MAEAVIGQARWTTVLVAVLAAVWLLCLTPMVRNKLSIFAEALVVIADQTFFVLLCTYCVVPLLIHAMHGIFKAEEEVDGGGGRELQSLYYDDDDDDDSRASATTTAEEQKRRIQKQQHQQQQQHHIAYGFFANVAFVVISVLILLRVAKELFGVNLSSFFNFANTLSVGIGFAFNDTINNVINGLVSQVSLQISRGQKVKLQNESDYWVVVQVGALGVTLSKKKKKDDNAVEFALKYVPHNAFVANAYELAVVEEKEKQNNEKNTSQEEQEKQENEGVDNAVFIDNNNKGASTTTSARRAVRMGL